jgi:hypothetical protein
VDSLLPLGFAFSTRHGKHGNDKQAHRFHAASLSPAEPAVKL